MRQQYIDILKGITIIWVLWMHMNLPEIIYPAVQMPIFFFLSGAFYRVKGSFSEQLKNDAYRLLLPTICFMIVAAILMTIRGNIIWSSNILNVLQYCRDGSITWFLIALFCFRTINYPFEHFNKKWLYVLFAAILYPIGFIWKVKYSSFVFPIVPLQEMFMFGIYYALGYAMGKRILPLISNVGGGHSLVGCIICVAYVVFVHFIDWKRGFWNHIPWLAYGFPYTIACIYLGLVISRAIEKSLILTKPLAYVGKNSIVFYLTHWPIWIFAFKPLGYDPIIVFIIITILEFPLIYIIINYLPWIVGQKKKK
ncbi:MAG: acyltransferase [Bacteroides sp.]|nr:acyltransferase [Bacteroides sp.]